MAQRENDDLYGSDYDIDKNYIIGNELVLKPKTIAINRDKNYVSLDCPNCNSSIKRDIKDYDNHEIICCPICDSEIMLNPFKK